MKTFSPLFFSVYSLSYVVGPREEPPFKDNYFVYRAGVGGGGKQKFKNKNSKRSLGLPALRYLPLRSDDG